MHGCAHVSSCCVCCGGVWCHGATGRFRDLVDQDLDWIQKPSTGLERRKYKHSLEGLADNLDVGDTEPIMLDTGVITRQRNLQHNKLRYLFGEIAVDLGRAEQLTIGDHKPDCMIMCSKLNHFANDCENVLCLNPGRLTKGVSGGTYARVVIQPYDLKNLEGKEDHAHVGHVMLERAAVEVSFGWLLMLTT